MVWDVTLSPREFRLSRSKTDMSTGSECVRELRTHRLLCLGIIRPRVGQEGCQLARGSYKDVRVCRIRQTAGIYAIYLRVALDEVRGSGHQRGARLAGPGTRRADLSGAERRWGTRCTSVCVSLRPGDSHTRLYVPSSSHNPSRMPAITPNYSRPFHLSNPGLAPSRF